MAALTNSFNYHLLERTKAILLRLHPTIPAFQLNHQDLDFFLATQTVLRLGHSAPGRRPGAAEDRDSLRKQHKT